jgi:hypothetical protein
VADFPFKEVKAGEQLSASQWNALVAFIKQSINVSVTAPLRMSRGTGGMAISLPWFFDLRMYRFVAELTPGSSAKARPMYFKTEDDVNDWVDVVSDPEDAGDVDLHCSLGSFSANVDDRVWAFWCRESGRFEVLQPACNP